MKHSSAFDNQIPPNSIQPPENYMNIAMCIEPQPQCCLSTMKSTFALLNPPPGFPPIPKAQKQLQPAQDYINGVKITNSDRILPCSLIVRTNGKVKTRLDSSSEDTTIVDIDSNVKDALLSPDIAVEVISNLMVMEGEKRPCINYMEKVQRHINPKLRLLCVDYLVGAAEQLGLGPDTLHLAVNCLDRYLSIINIRSDQLAFVGLTCLMMASKFQEVGRPHIDFYGYHCLTKNKYSNKDFINMESDILNHLKFEVAVPTAWSFLERFLYVAQGSEKAPIQRLECMAAFIAEMSLLAYTMLRFSPSIIAASCVFLAKYVLAPSKSPWNATLQHYTHHRTSDLCDCTATILGFCCGSSVANALSIRGKYSCLDYEYVSLELFPTLIPAEYLED